MPVDTGAAESSLSPRPEAARVPLRAGAWAQTISGALHLRARLYLLADLTLLQRFMLFCAVVLTLVAVVLGQRMAANVQRDMVRSTAFNTALYIGSVIGSELEQPDRTLRLTERSRELLDALFSPQHVGSEIVAIKVWSQNGEIIYATEKALIGQRFPVEDDLREALSGDVHYEVSELSRSENAFERHDYRRLLEVYAPIRSHISREVIGASEVYQRVDRIPEFISASRREVWLLVGLAFVLLYVALSGIVRQASETIAHQNEQLREANERLEQQSVTDFLTRLYNHRYFQERLDEELRRAARARQPLSLLFCDIDHFKTFNDRFGHQAGDQALRATAQVIRTTLRSTDIAARYGGEEFTAILPHTTKSAALDVAERLRRNVEASLVILPDGQTVPVTISIGVAGYPDDGEHKAVLVRRADSALYRAKDEGRNRVVAPVWPA